MQKFGVITVEKRNYGIDLLRLVLMFMVCLLHILGQGDVIRSYSFGTVQYGTFMVLETFSCCAVNAFAILSGYMSTDKPQNYSKIIQMWLQVFFYSFILTVLLCLFGFSKWNIKELFKSAFPVTFEYYWYFTAYFAAFFFMPVINKFVAAISESTAKKTLIVLAVLFSVLETVAYPFQTKNGHSAIWLIVLYFIGALSKKIKLFAEKKNSFLIALLILCNATAWAFAVFLGTGQLIIYIAPTMVLSGLLMVILFSRIKLKGTIIKRLSPLAFGVYLFHLNNIIWNRLDGAAAKILSSNLFVAILQVLLFAAAVFTVGLIVEYIRQKIAKLLNVSKISNLLANTISKSMEKLFPILK